MKVTGTSAVRICAFAAAAILVFSSPASGASSGVSAFSDVKTGYWGAPYIEFAASKAIINGYPQTDGSFRFKPEDPVSKEEAMQMLYKTMKNAGFSSEITGDHKELLAAAKISPWAFECVSYGLDHGVLDASELQQFRNSAGASAKATREEVARWASKAAEGILLPAVSLDFADTSNIKIQNLYYVDHLARMGVMLGDNKNNFNPGANIKRVEYAAICKRLYALAEASYDPGKESRSYQGVITKVDGASRALTLSQGTKAFRIIHIADSTEIFADGVRTSFQSLPTGKAVVVAWGPFGQVHVATAPQVFSGQITEMKQRNADCTELAVMLSGGDVVRYFLSEKGTTVDGVPKTGEEVRLLTDGVELVELVVL